MAGYNTMSEILRFHKPAVIVPREGPSAEQRMRAGIFAERGLVTQVDPQDISAERLASAILEALTRPRSPCTEAMPGLFGVRVATDALLEFLSPRSEYGSLGAGEKTSCQERSRRFLSPRSGRVKSELQC